MITFKDYLEHNHPEVLDEAWWHGALAGLGLMTGLAGGSSAQAASSGSPITTTRVDGKNSTRSGDARSGQVSDQINVLKGMVDDLTRGESSGVSVTPSGARTENGKVVGGSSEPTEPFVLGHGIKNPRGGGEIRR